MYPCPPVRFRNLSITKIDLSSLKLFNTTNVDIIRPNNCQQYFDVKLRSILWYDRVSCLEKNFAESNNSFFAKYQLKFDGLHLSLC